MTKIPDDVFTEPEDVSPDTLANLVKPMVLGDRRK